MDSQEMKTVLFKLLSIVGVSQEHNLHDILYCDKLFEIAWADFYQSLEEEIVSIDHQLNEELCLLLLNVEVIRIDILNNACKVLLGNAFYLNDALLL